MLSVNRQRGLSLLEVLLVLVIGGFILYLSVQQYILYRHDADVTQVRYNVDLLFQAAGKYFRANCSSNAQLSQGSSTVYPLKIDELRQNGYLTQSLPISPIVAGTNPDEGYAVQLNRYLENGNLPSRFVKDYLGNNKPVGSIVIWQIQVSAKLADPTTATQYKNLLLADCLATGQSSGGGTVVSACTQAGSSGDYAAWVRAPSFNSGPANSPYWLTMPTVKQFKQEYTTNEILVLMDGTMTDSQYYVCGS